MTNMATDNFFHVIGHKQAMQLGDPVCSTVWALTVILFATNDQWIMFSVTAPGSIIQNQLSALLIRLTINSWLSCEIAVQISFGDLTICDKFLLRTFQKHL